MPDRRRQHVVIYFLLLFTQFTINIALRETVEYQNPVQCKNYEIFNTTSLSCGLCNFTQNLEPSENRLHCVCSKNSKIIGFDKGVPVCEPCKNQTTVTLDGLHCIKCRKDSKRCSCLPNEIQIEKNASGEYLEFVQCLPCPFNMYPSPDKSQCQANAYFSYGDLSNLRISTFKKMNQSEGVKKHESDDFYLKIESQVVKALCKNGSATACEHLSNMCTLSMFSNEIVCDLFLNETNSHWLYYNKDDNAKILNQDIPMRYSLKSKDDNSKLNISVITYKLNGEFESIDEPNILCGLLKDINFGINVDKNCFISVKELLNRETSFYSTFLMYKEDDKKMLHNIPILVRNINKAENVSEWQLVKKFFLVDTVRGSSLSNLNSFKSSTFSLRYLQSLSLKLHVEPNNQNKLQTPFIVASYGELTENQVMENEDIEIKYKIEFVVKANHIDTIMKISICVFSAIAILYSLLKTWSYCKRNHNQQLHLLVMVKFIVFSCGLVANVFMIVSVCTCIYVFILYKGQTMFHVPLPGIHTENNMMLYTTIAFAFKCIEMIDFIQAFRSCKIFFIDWEQPRTLYTRYLKDRSPSMLRNKSRQKRRKSASIVVTKRKKSEPVLRRTEFSDSRENLSIIYKPREQVDNVIQYQANELPVSIWRTYFVAKEWLELQSTRKINVLVQIIFILLALEVVGMKHYSNAIPELKLETERKGNYSLTLHYGIGALVYLSFYILQWLMIVIFYEKCIYNKIQHFVDLCSTANISTIILTHNFFGFYIHGRSVHGFADTDLQTLSNDLQKEQNNLCAHRGLVPGTVDQTFIISLSPPFHYFYNKIFTDQTQEILQTYDSNYLPWQHDFQVHMKAKKFLTSFIDHCFYEMDYIIKDRLMCEKLLDIELQNPVEKTIFYTDSKNNFDAATLHGNEWTIGTFEFVQFIFVLTFSKDYIISCLTVLIASQLLLIICKLNSKRNLANKTLIDDRLMY